ncbi:glycosyltransferase [Rhodanobacter thiooxydans]|uniref:glycosyltransferase n=1 Tax=Rhodanobacter thiooxydans TaxID=416169 RepID=UPI0009EE3CA2|nr:glycosyltransferase [Rhodanobacter thiooxydans]
MKILLYVSQLSAGGAEQAALLLASGLTELQHKVIIVTSSLRGELVSRINENSVTIDLASKKPIRSLRKIAHCIDNTKPDAVVCFGINTGIAAALSKFIFRWNVEIFIRNENNLYLEWRGANTLNRFIGPLLSRWSARRSHMIAVSHSLAKATADYLHLAHGKVAAILNPVLDDTTLRRIPLKPTLHPWLQDPSIPTFVAMGRLEYQKGFDILVNAFAQVRRHVHVRLVIFGNGRLRGALQAQIDACGLHNDAVLAGFTSDPIVQMHAAHAFVLSSRFEGFGLVLVEALWSGTRVISTDCDFGPAEVLEEGRFGTLVPVNDVNALAAAILASINQPRIIQRPPDRWFEQFTATQAARQHVTLIESLR